MIIKETVDGPKGTAVRWNLDDFQRAHLWDFRCAPCSLTMIGITEEQARHELEHHECMSTNEEGQFVVAPGGAPTIVDQVELLDRALAE